MYNKVSGRNLVSCAPGIAIRSQLQRRVHQDFGKLTPIYNLQDYNEIFLNQFYKILLKNTGIYINAYSKMSFKFKKILFESEIKTSEG